MSRLRVCRLEDVEVGTVRRFTPEGTSPVAVARCDDGIHVVVDNCSHEDYPLSEGEVFSDVCEIECVRHGSTFSLLDGEPQSLPATKPITVLSVEVVDGDIVVEVP